MIQPLRSALSSTRLAALRPTRRKMVSAAVIFPVDEPPPSSYNLQILDIFDAPSRLGESSRLFALNAAASRLARPFSAQTVSRQRPAVKPLPTPVVFDGPARPRRTPFVSFRAYGSRPSGPAATRAGVVTPPNPLPNPVLFDGPSRLRPYARSGAWGSSSAAASLAKTATPIMLAVAAAVGLFGLDITSLVESPSQDHTHPTDRHARLSPDA